MITLININDSRLVTPGVTLESVERSDIKSTDVIDQPDMLIVYDCKSFKILKNRRTYPLPFVVYPIHVLGSIGSLIY